MHDGKCSLVNVAFWHDETPPYVFFDENDKLSVALTDIKYIFKEYFIVGMLEIIYI